MPYRRANKLQKRTHDQRSASDGLYRAYLYATIIGVAIGLAGLGFIYWQIRIARRTADAAKASADALVNIERPWLLILDADYSGEMAIQHEPERIAAIWKFKNFGKTPAFIEAVLGSLEIVNDPNELPVPARYRTTDFSDDPVIAPGQESSYIEVCSRKYWGWQVRLGSHISALPTDRNRKGGAANLRRFLVYLL